MKKFIYITLVSIMFAFITVSIYATPPVFLDDSSSSGSTSSTDSVSSTSSTATTPDAPAIPENYYVKTFAPYDFSIALPIDLVLKYDNPEKVFTAESGTGDDIVHWECVDSIYGYEYTHWEALSGEQFNEVIKNQSEWMKNQGTITNGVVEPYLVDNIKFVKSTYKIKDTYHIDYETYWGSMTIALVFTKEGKDFTQAEKDMIKISIDSVVFEPRKGSRDEPPTTHITPIDKDNTYPIYIFNHIPANTILLIIVSFVILLFIITLLLIIYFLNKKQNKLKQQLIDKNNQI